MVSNNVNIGNLHFSWNPKIKYYPRILWEKPDFIISLMTKLFIEVLPYYLVSLHKPECCIQLNPAIFAFMLAIAIANDMYGCK